VLRQLLVVRSRVMRLPAVVVQRAQPVVVAVVESAVYNILEGAGLTLRQLGNALYVQSAVALDSGKIIVRDSIGSHDLTQFQTPGVPLELSPDNVCFYHPRTQEFQHSNDVLIQKPLHICLTDMVLEASD
jgi:hypothetical protein